MLSQQMSEHAVRDNSRHLKTIIMRLPHTLVAEIDAFGGDRYLHRSERIGGLLTAGLKSEEAQHGCRA